MGYNSVKFFLNSLMANLWGLDLNEWAITSLGSGRDSNDNWLWTIHLKNIETKEEKIIRIPCYKD